MRTPPLALVIALCTGLAACSETSRLQVSDGTGPSPRLPEPNKTLIPTVNIAPAIGWPQGAKPVAATGIQVAAFAEDLDVTETAWTRNKVVQRSGKWIVPPAS